MISSEERTNLVFYSWMTNKSEKAYTEILNRIEEIVGCKIKLKSLVTDQEQVRDEIYDVSSLHKISFIPLKHSIKPWISDLMFQKYTDALSTSLKSGKFR